MVDAVDKLMSELRSACAKEQIVRSHHVIYAQEAIATLRTELEQVKRERDEANAMLADAYGSPVEGHKLFAERLAGARVKPLEWKEAIHGGWVALGAAGVYHVHVGYQNDTRFYFFTNPFDHEPNEFCSEAKAKAAAQADYERRILSALAEPAGEFDRIVSDSSEFVASLSDSMRATGRSVFNPPESAGEAGPVAWRRKWNFRGRPCEDEFTCSAALADQWRTHPQTDEVIGLYATPPDASAIRGAMEKAERSFETIRIALVSSWSEPGRTAFWEAVDARNALRAALAGAKP